MNYANLESAIKSSGVTKSHLCRLANKSNHYIADCKNGCATPSDDILSLWASVLGTSLDFLKGKTDDPTPPEKQKTAPAKANAEIEHNDIFMIPVYDSVSAGFGAYADDYITDYMPMQFTSPREAEESIFVTVRGDSMYPKIEDGDTILVHKQESVEQGSIAVVLVGEEALVKRVFCYDSRVELHSINPMYPPQKYSGTDAAKVSVLGLVKKIIKNA